MRRFGMTALLFMAQSLRLSWPRKAKFICACESCYVCALNEQLLFAELFARSTPSKLSFMT